MDVGARQQVARYDAGRPQTTRRGAIAATVWAVWLIVANAAVIVWLWARGGNVSGVHSMGDLLTSLGRVTGLLSAYLASSSC